MQKIQKAIFRLVRFLVWLFYPKTEIAGLENLPQEPSLIIGNHSQMNGPIIGELYFPGERYTWCAGEMMELKKVPAYAYRDFWRNKPGCIRWFYKILSFVIAPLSVCVFNHARTIGVYHDRRIISTFKETIKGLSEGANIIIFPEHDAPHNHILCDFQEGFVDVAAMYYKRTGKILNFVPLYIAPALSKAYLGKPIPFQPENTKEAERRRICDYLMAEITQMAEALPRHRVVPYNNLPKKHYHYSKEADL